MAERRTSTTESYYETSGRLPRVRLFVAVAYIRTVADRAGMPVRQICQELPGVDSVAIHQPAQDLPDVSGANEMGSQTGSQRRQTPGRARQQPAMVSAARSLIRPHPATCSDAADAPEKRKVSGSTPPLTTNQLVPRPG